MAIEQLATELRNEYSKAGRGDRALSVHLFGLRNADRLDGVNLYELAARAGISRSYGSELYKAVRLAEYVVPR